MQAVLRDVRDGVILVEYPGSSGDEANPRGSVSGEAAARGGGRGTARRGSRRADASRGVRSRSAERRAAEAVDRARDRHGDGRASRIAVAARSRRVRRRGPRRARVGTRDLRNGARAASRGRPLSCGVRRLRAGIRLSLRPSRGALDPTVGDTATARAGRKRRDRRLVDRHLPGRPAGGLAADRPDLRPSLRCARGPAVAPRAGGPRGVREGRPGATARSASLPACGSPAGRSSRAFSRRGSRPRFRVRRATASPPRACLREARWISPRSNSPTRSSATVRVRRRSRSRSPDRNSRSSGTRSSRSREARRRSRPGEELSCGASRLPRRPATGFASAALRGGPASTSRSAEAWEAMPGGGSPPETP